MRVAGSLQSDNTPGKNAIINGCMRLAQRGSSFVIGQSSAAYTLDRWRQANSHVAGNITTTQESSIVPDSTFGYSLKITNAAGNDTSVDNGDLCNINHRVEGYNIRQFVGGYITLSFWARSSKIGIYCVSLRNAGVDRTYLAEYTIATANVWQRYTIQIPMNYSGGTWDYINGVGLYVSFILMCGPTYGTAGSWQTGNFYATANQVNWLNETNTFYITGVQLEPGVIVTDFERRDIDTELRLCQRYYQRYNAGATYSPFANGCTFGGAEAYVQVPLQTEMRALPVLSYSAVGDFSYIAGGTTSSISAMSIVTNNVSNKVVTLGLTISGTTGQGGWMRAYGTTNAWLGFESEL